MFDGGYPPGAAWDPDAPYNQTDNPPVEIEVDVCLSISLRTKISVTDYKTEDDFSEDGGRVVYDFSDCDLARQAEEQITLPTDTEMFKDWIVDDFFVQEAY